MILLKRLIKEVEFFESQKRNIIIDIIDKDITLIINYIEYNYNKGKIFLLFFGN